jgi:hypothetical protein
MKLKYLFVASSLLFLGCEKDARQTDVPYGVAISDGNVIEGNAGQNKVIEFDITLDAAVFGSDNVTVEVITQEGTAKNNVDFVPLVRQITPFASGEKTKKIQIEIVEDAVKEADEEFSVVINSVSANAKILDGTGVGKILNDD